MPREITNQPVDEEGGNPAVSRLRGHEVAEDGVSQLRWRRAPESTLLMLCR
jgi:hypothetical protein